MMALPIMLTSVIKSEPTFMIDGPALWGTACWLGLLTAVSPCPLATNLAATACLARRVDSRLRGAMGALVYTLGRVSAYAVIALILKYGILAAPAISQALQRWTTPILGPILILTAMVLLGLITLPVWFSAASQSGAEKWASRGITGEFILGFLFALSFCPVSAAIFFGSLLPLTLASGQLWAPIMAYGIGTAAPVAVFALIMTASTRASSKLLGGITRTQPFMMKLAGFILLAAGLYLTARDTLAIIS